MSRDWFSLILVPLKRTCIYIFWFHFISFKNTCIFVLFCLCPYISRVMILNQYWSRSRIGVNFILNVQNEKAEFLMPFWSFVWTKCLKSWKTLLPGKYWVNYWDAGSKIKAQRTQFLIQKMIFPQKYKGLKNSIKVDKLQKMCNILIKSTYSP